LLVLVAGIVCLFFGVLAVFTPEASNDQRELAFAGLFLTSLGAGMALLH
jgi:hypothetical protein